MGSRQRGHQVVATPDAGGGEVVRRQGRAKTRVRVRAKGLGRGRVTRAGRTAARRGWAGSNGARRGGTPVARAAWWNGARVRLARQATASKTQARLKSSLD